MSIASTSITFNETIFAEYYFKEPDEIETLRLIILEVYMYTWDTSQDVAGHLIWPTQNDPSTSSNHCTITSIYSAMQHQQDTVIETNGSPTEDRQQFINIAESTSLIDRGTSPIPSQPKLFSTTELEFPRTRLTFQTFLTSRKVSSVKMPCEQSFCEIECSAPIYATGDVDIKCEKKFR